MVSKTYADNVILVCNNRVNDNIVCIWVVWRYFSNGAFLGKTDAEHKVVTT